MVSSWKRNLGKTNGCEDSEKDKRVGAGSSWYVGGSFLVLKSSNSIGMGEREQGRRGSDLNRKGRERGMGVEKQQLV